MTEEMVRQIIREELAGLIHSDRYIFEKFIQLLDGRNIQVGTATGTKIGTETTQKLGLWNTTPVDQPETVANPEDAGGSYVQANIQTMSDATKAIISRLKEVGIIKSA